MRPSQWHTRRRSIPIGLVEKKYHPDHIYIYIYYYIYIYIYIYGMCVYIYVFIYMCIYILYIFIYLCKASPMNEARLSHLPFWGPSEGFFLID